MKLIIICIGIWVYCIISNMYWYLKSKRLYGRFTSGKEMSSYIPEVDEIFKQAGTSYPTYYDENKGGYKQRCLTNVAYLCDRKKYQLEVEKVFLITIGTFRNRLKHSIFPIHIIFLPAHWVQTKNIHLPFILNIILTGIYWLIGSLAAYHLNAFLDFTYLEYLQKLFEKIL